MHLRTDNIADDLDLFLLKKNSEARKWIDALWCNVIVISYFLLHFYCHINLWFYFLVRSIGYILLETVIAEAVLCLVQVYKPPPSPPPFIVGKEQFCHRRVVRGEQDGWCRLHISDIHFFSILNIAEAVFNVLSSSYNWHRRKYIWYNHSLFFL